MKSRLIQIAGACFLITLASGVLAQSPMQPGPAQLGSPPQPGIAPRLGGAPQLGNPGIAGKLDVGKQGLVTPLAGPWTTDNVSAEEPFGKIDVSRAGTTTAQVRTWAQTQTPMERNELSGRCGVIEDPANSSRYPANAQEFCRTYAAMSVITPPALNYKY